MDRFVVRGKNNLSLSVKNSNSDYKRLKQAKLKQLGGVVIIEHLISANEKLSDPSTPNEKKIEILNTLKEKKPAKEILKSTKIGKTVHRLCRDDSPEVSSVATDLYQIWKSHILHLLNRKPIEVQSDEETQRGRASARRLINCGLSDSDLAETIEGLVFTQCNRIMNHTYSRIVRKIHFCLKNDQVQLQRVSEKDCDLKEFVNEIFKNVIKVYAK